jgi:Family of unknown function (DUF6807)
MRARLLGSLVLPTLWVCALGAACGAEPVVMKPAAHSVEVLIGGRPFTTYYFDPAIAKPYFFPLRSPQGAVVTRSFPMVDNIPGEDRDEPHQRAMFFGHGKINGLDFWNEYDYLKWSGHHSASAFGRTVIQKLDEAEGGANSGTLRAGFNLVDSSGAVVAEETQAFVLRGDENTRTIDCEFTIRATHGPVTMGDEKDGTFAIRLVKALDSPPGRMVNSEGGVGEKEIWGKRANWVDYDGIVAGESVGVAVFDSPLNFRHPTYWHARAYGLLAANPFGLSYFTHNKHENGSYTFPAGGELVLRYRVFIHRGDYQQAGVAEAYQEYERGSRR